MSSNLAMDIDDTLVEIKVLAEKVKVMIGDIRRACFGQETEDIEETWKVTPPYHILAGIKVDIADDLVFDMMKQLKVLRELTDKIA